VQAVQVLQRLAGNQAVARLIEGPTTRVQRAGELAPKGPPPALGKGQLSVAPPTAVLQFPGDTPFSTAPFGPGKLEDEFKPELPGNSPDKATKGGAVLLRFNTSWHFAPMHEALIEKVPVLGITSPNRPVALDGEAIVEVNVPFSLKLDPQAPAVLTLLQARYATMASHGKGGALAGAPVTTDITPDGGAVTLTPSLQFQEQVAQAEQVGMSASVTSGATPLGLPTVTGGGSVADQEQLAVNINENFSRSYTAKLKVGQPGTLPRESSFARTHFRVDSDTLESEEVLGKWYLGQSESKEAGTEKGADLSDPARCAIESGNAPIYVTGYASATASFAHNQKLARKRAQKVKQLIVDLAGDGAKVITKAMGKYKAHGGERREDRKAVIEVRSIELSPDAKCEKSSEGPEPPGNEKVPS